MGKSIIARNTGGGGNEPQGRQGFLSKIPFFKFFSKSKFSVSNENKYYVGVKPQPTLNCVGRIEKRLIKDSPCHPELAAPLVADEKEAYKGGCSQSISGSSHRQKYSAICTQKTNVGLKAQPTLISVSSCRRSIVMHGLRPHSPRRVAFTLAEVLITLGIIGVVAALTMPTLLQKVESEVIKNQFKKVYSMLSQVYVKAEADLGYKPSCFYADDGSGGSNIEDCEDLLNAVEKNLVIIKKCEKNALRNGCLPKSSYAGITEALKDNNPDISDDESNFWIANCGGLSKSNIENNTRTLVLKDGVILMFYYSGSISYPQMISVDVNGAKGPNKWGYDVFNFAVASLAGRSLRVKGMSAGVSCTLVEKGGVSSAEFINNLYK